MAHKDKEKVERNAAQITDWLVDNLAAFESTGIAEEGMAGAVKLPGDDATTAVDHLENHEIVVRDPVALTKPPRFLLKPGRGWAGVRSKLLESRSAGGSR